jgi:magnesium-transporting ATPase (P-type)
MQVILYSFYKNIVLTLILFYFNFSTGFSGQPLFEDWVYSGCVPPHTAPPLYIQTGGLPSSR